MNERQIAELIYEEKLKSTKLQKEQEDLNYELALLSRLEETNVKFNAMVLNWAMLMDTSLKRMTKKWTLLAFMKIVAAEIHVAPDIEDG